MPDFDFRAAMGGKVEVPADPVLADGLGGQLPLAGLCGNMTSKLPGIEVMTDMLSQMVLMNANTDNLCAGAVVALVIERMHQKTDGLPPEFVAHERKHFLGEVRAMLERLEAENGL